ncbi:hypothetical protein [Shinella zoogloeoides]|uniref:hypothetical protein n=1 Tax=Shinella zoogloeoides TaxID=352475 RepID=UPI00273E17C0|nr:hypothetical protein [Shinella zoogloeoides]WLR92155.1 hypothetical protein Q9316_17060 [Shinella zoogloeoides]
MEKQPYIPREPSILERSANIASGYIIIVGILAMGLFGLACTLQLVKIERQMAVEARV